MEFVEAFNIILITNRQNALEVIEPAKYFRNTVAIKFKSMFNFNKPNKIVNYLDVIL